VDIEELLTKSQQEEADEHQKIAMAAIQTPRSADPDRSRTRAINAKIDYMDCRSFLKGNSLLNTNLNNVFSCLSN